MSPFEICIYWPLGLCISRVLKEATPSDQVVFVTLLLTGGLPTGGQGV